MNVFDDERLEEGPAGDKLTGVKKVIVLAYVPDIQEQGCQIEHNYAF